MRWRTVLSDTTKWPPAVIKHRVIGVESANEIATPDKMHDLTWLQIEKTAGYMTNKPHTKQTSQRLRDDVTPPPIPFTPPPPPQTPGRSPTPRCRDQHLHHDRRRGGVRRNSYGKLTITSPNAPNVSSRCWLTVSWARLPTNKVLVALT